MPRPIKLKQLQVVEQYADGATCVYQDQLAIKWRDFPKAGIRRRIDWATGKPFLLLLIKYGEVDPDQTFEYA
jgi:hypothetical protein